MSSLCIRLIALSALLACACSSPETRQDAQIVVVVETDFAIPAGLSEVEFYVRRVNAKEELAQIITVPLSGKLGVKPPLVLPIAPEDDLNTPVEVRVEGYLGVPGGGRTLQVRRLTRLRFQPGKTVQLRMDLVSACAATFLECEQNDRTCAAEGCVGIDEPDTAPWSGDPSEGSPFEQPDAGADGSDGSDGTPDGSDGTPDGSDGTPDGSDGDGGTGDHDRPVQLALGENHSCVRTAQGRVFCWGKGDYGELGNGSLNHGHTCSTLGDQGTHSCTWTPVAVTNLPAASQLTAGVYTTCAIHTPRANYAGNVSCWGQAFDAANEAPVPVVFEGIRVDNALEVKVGGKTGCVRREGELPVCFGEHFDGELGNGTIEYPGRIALSSALEGLATPAQLLELAVGDRHVCARVEGGGVLCWGNNEWAQTGQPLGAALLTPTAMPMVTGVDAIAAAGTQTCLLTDGVAACLGEDTWGQLGNARNGDDVCQVYGSCRDEPRPVRVDQVDGGDVAQLAMGYLFSCVRFADGRIACFGNNEHGQLGERLVENESSIPVELPAPLDDVVELAAGAHHACAILGDERVVCWGLNDAGQLGVSPVTTPDSNVPVVVPLPL